MIFEACPVPKALADYIDSIFYFEGLSPDHSRERLVPTGNSFLLFELDGIPRHTLTNDGEEILNTYTKSWISGAHQEHISLSVPPSGSMLAIQFSYFGALPFLHQNLSNLSNSVVPSEEILSDEIFELRSLILRQKETKKKFDVLLQWLNNRFDQKYVADVEIKQILHRLKEEPASKFQEIIGKYSKSQKHLISEFKKHNGLTPKQLHKVFRFNKILQVIQDQKKIEWSMIAYECGFADQSHFIKEFKLYSGMNPQTFITNNFQHRENFYPLDREG